MDMSRSDMGHFWVKTVKGWCTFTRVLSFNVFKIAASCYKGARIPELLCGRVHAREAIQSTSDYVSKKWSYIGLSS